MVLKIAKSSHSKYIINFSILFENWELISQYLWGRISRTIKQDSQFKPKLKLNIVTQGSKDENKLDIFKVQIYTFA